MSTVAKKAEPLTPASIKAIRVRLKLTQTQAAAKVGVSRRSWAAWEAGDQIPSPPLAILIRILDAEKI